MTKIKICGITTLKDALTAAEAGADMLGFNFYPKSPRCIPPEACRAITSVVRQKHPHITLVGVFVNASVSEIRATLQTCHLHLAQLHGDEPPETLAELGNMAFKAIRLSALPTTEGSESADPSAFIRLSALPSTEGSESVDQSVDQSADPSAFIRLSVSESVDESADPSADQSASLRLSALPSTEGSESVDQSVYKSVYKSVDQSVDPSADRPALLVDSAVKGLYGGSGVTTDWEAAASLARQIPLLLAGGLTPENVAAAVRQVRPWGVDVASGVESSPGRKEPGKVKRFVEEVRKIP